MLALKQTFQLIKIVLGNKFAIGNKLVLGNKIVLGNKLVLGNKIVPGKQDDINELDSSNKQDLSNNYITVADPDLLFDKLRETLSKSVMTESDYTMTQMIIDELLRIKCITRKQCKAMCEKICLV